jgi:phospholipase D1/2
VMHPTGTFPSKWSHHQKSVIVDRSIGFCGGIDLCFGRYDDRSHTLQDNCHLRTRFPGKDFYNPGISACDNLVMPWEG